MVNWLLYLLSILSACEGPNADTKWAETEAEISSEEKFEDKFIAVIRYNAPESTAVNQEGKPIRGPIQASWLDKKKPVDHQKIRIKYLKEEPMIYKELDKIRY
jgi:hypothetical protein